MIKSDNNGSCIINIGNLDPRKIVSFNYRDEESFFGLTEGEKVEETTKTPSSENSTKICSDSEQTVESSRKHSLTSCSSDEMKNSTPLCYKQARKMSSNVKWMVWEHRLKNL